jgi:dTMP kinase
MGSSVDEKRNLRFDDYVYAASLVNPSQTSSSVSILITTDADVKRILALFQRNKVPLVYLDNEKLSFFPEFFHSVQFHAIFKNEEALLRELRGEWLLVRDEFLSSGIESILIKAVDSFPYKSSNLDVLIKNGKRNNAEAILKDLRYVQLHNVEEPYKTLFRKFSKGKTVSIIHLHDKIAWINPFHDEERLWKYYRNSKIDVFVDVPSPEDSILILTAHWFYEDKELKLSDIINISSSIKKGRLDWEYMTDVAGAKGWLNGLYFGLLVHSFVEKTLFGASSIDEAHLQEMKIALPRWMRIYLEKNVYLRPVSLPFKLPKLFGKYLHFVKTAGDKTTKLSRKLVEIYSVAHASLFVVLFNKFNINIRYQPPMLVSFSGVDGSGKTTYAETLSATLKFCELKTRYVWCRVGSSSFLKPFTRIGKMFFGSLKGARNSADSVGSKESGMGTKELFKRSSLLRKVGITLLLAEMLWQYFSKVSIPLLLKRVVVCDRYVYDTLADITTRYGIDPDSNEGRFFANMLMRLIPKADKSYVIRLSLEDICSRRKLSFKEKNEVQQQMACYEKLSSLYNLQEIHINNEKDVKEISNEIINDVLSTYYCKWDNNRSRRSIRM